MNCFVLRPFGSDPNRDSPATALAPIQSYQKPDGSFVSKPLEDLFPFLPREEFLANMIVEPLPE